MANVINNTPVGKVRDFAPMVQYVRNNRIYQRQLAKAPRNAKTPDQMNERDDMADFVKIWANMSAASRATWTAYAGQTIRQRAFRATNPLKVLSPFGAFVQARLMQARVIRINALLGFTGNPTLAPLGEGQPDFPTAVAVAYAAGTATVTWVDPVAFDGAAVGQAVEIWIKVVDNTGAFVSWGQLAGAVAIGVQTFTFTTVKSRSEGSIVVTPILLSNILKGRIRVQLRFVEQHSATKASNTSVFSGQAEVGFTNP